MSKKTATKKRTDSKGRNLNTGEYQRKDGSYEYKYKDKSGKSQSIYSWMLFDTDEPPAGKQCVKSLRAMEEEITKDRIHNLDISRKAQKKTLNQAWDDYLATAINLKDSTRENYTYMWNHFVRESFGSKKVKDITYTDVKKFYIYLIEERGLSVATLESIHTLVHPALTTAVRNEWRLNNPSDGVMAAFKVGDWKSERIALTEEQQRNFLQYVKESETFNHFYPLFITMFGTGARIGEILGLRIIDCDFRKEEIDINHQLIYRKNSKTGKMELHITTTKTKNSNRKVPMMPQVKEALMEEIDRRTRAPCKSIVDGYGGFVFTTRFSRAMTPHNVNRAIERIVKTYNEQEEIAAKEEHRIAELLPHFTCHNARHTFASRMCEQVSDEVVLKSVQAILGHASFETTMDVYAKANEKKNKQAMIAMSRCAVFG